MRTSVVLGLRLLVQAGTLLLVARMLGPHDFGAFAGVTALAVMLGTLSTFGTHIVLLGEESRETASQIPVLPYALPTTLICGSVLFGIFLLLAKTLLREVNISSEVLIAVGLTELILQPLLNLPGARHQGQGRIAASQLLMTLPLALRLLTAAGIWRLQVTEPLRGYAYGYVAASALALLVASFSLKQAWPAVRSWRLPLIAELRHAAGYAVLNLTAASPTELDKTLALKLLPMAAAGVYAAGTRVIGALTLPVIAMMLSAMPRLFREGHTKHARSGRLLQSIFTASFVYSFLLGLALWLTAPLFERLFGSRYHGLGETIRWLIPAVPGMALRISAGSILMAVGHPWMRVGFELIGLTALFLAATILTTQFGAIGMPLALGFSEWGMVLCGGFFVYRTWQSRSPARSQ